MRVAEGEARVGVVGSLEGAGFVHLVKAELPSEEASLDASETKVLGLPSRVGGRVGESSSNPENQVLTQHRVQHQAHVADLARGGHDAP